jgi:hypothetical protein
MNESEDESLITCPPKTLKYQLRGRPPEIRNDAVLRNP